MHPRPGDPVTVEIRGRLAFRKRGVVGVFVDGWARPVTLHLVGDPDMGVPNPPAPDIRVAAAPPPVLTPGVTYTARGDVARRFFAIGASEGVQLVDELGTHWPPDVVVRQWGPLDRLPRPGDAPAGLLYDRGADDTAVVPPVPDGVDGYAPPQRGAHLATVHPAGPRR